MQPQIDPYKSDSDKQKKLIVWSGVAAGVVLLLGAGFALLAMRGTEAPPTLVQANAPTTPILPAKAEEPAPVLPAETGMPREILDWLEHLRKTDAERVSMTQQQVGAAMGKLVLHSVTSGLTQDQLFAEDGPQVEQASPTKAAAESFREISESCAKLTKAFNDYPPPAECADIAAQYNTALQETEQMPLELASALDSFMQNPTGAQEAVVSAMGTSKNRIDAASIRADALVQAICDKYKTRKWFDLKPNVASGLDSIIQQYNPLSSGK